MNRVKYLNPFNVQFRGIIDNQVIFRRRRQAKTRDRENSIESQGECEALIVRVPSTVAEKKYPLN